MHSYTHTHTNRLGRKLKKKQSNIIEERKGDAREHMKDTKSGGEKASMQDKEEVGPVSVLDRFKFKDT
jgi:hypothetical protein